MTITELIQQKSEKKDKMNELLSVAQEANRELNEDEQQIFDEPVEAIEKIDEAIAEKETELEEKSRNLKPLKPMSKRSANKQFSLLRAINSVVQNRSFDSVDAEVINYGFAEARKAGVNA